MTPFMVIFGGLVLIAFWLVVLVRWRWGYMGLLVFLPFAGIVALRMHGTKEVLLLKDFIFALPAYVSFFFFHRRDKRRVQVPRLVLVAMGFLTLLVILQVMNPEIVNLTVAAIGLKVWLFYMPLLFLTSAYVDSREDLARLLRILVVIAIIPCAIGILQWFGAMTFGFETTMESFYDEEAARAATSNFGIHEYGGKLFRIPSTFTFTSQYFGYTMGMVVFAYCLMRADPSPRWRRFGLIMVGFCVVASALSGARGALVFIPLLLVTTAFLDQRLSGILGVVIAVPVIILTALHLGGLDPQITYGATGILVDTYSKDIVYENIINAFLEHPLGIGTGMNTGAARHAFSSDAQASTKLSFLENYYAKAMVELGFIGLPAALAVFVSIIFKGLGVLRGLRDRGLRGAAAVLVAFFIIIAIHSGKGWQVDYDPINVYLWIFAGILFKLTVLDGTPALPAAVSRKRRPVATRTLRAPVPVRGVRRF
ncbi:MAG: O-antigen ligase family protein [Alphaproteobacteria bacterium]